MTQEEIQKIIDSLNGQTETPKPQEQSIPYIAEIKAGTLYATDANGHLYKRNYAPQTALGYEDIYIYTPKTAYHDFNLRANSLYIRKSDYLCDVNGNRVSANVEIMQKADRRIRELKAIIEQGAINAYNSGLIDNNRKNAIIKDVNDKVTEYKKVKEGKTLFSNVPEQKPEYVAKSGDKSNTVLDIQKKLQELGYTSQQLTGQYNDITLNNIAYFQIINGLTVTGWVDKENTYNKLINKYSNFAEIDEIEKDTDGDGLSDEEELIIGTNPLIPDTDGDGLSDGLEYILGFDPLLINADGDSFNDYQEYQNGTDPFIYNKTKIESIAALSAGFVYGDFQENAVAQGLIKQTTADSFEFIIGQIVSGLAVAGDARDAIANALKGEWGWAILNGAALAPVVGDIAGIGGKVTSFISKNIDNVDEIAKLTLWIAKENEELLKWLSKTDVFKGYIKNSLKNNLRYSKSTLKYLDKAGELIEAGVKYSDDISKATAKSGVKVSKVFDSAKELEKVGDKTGGIFFNTNFSHISRGKWLDKMLGNNLGEFFPVFDKFADGTLTSIKSIDTTIENYKNPSKFKSVIEKNLDSIVNFGEKYFKSSSIVGRTSNGIESFVTKEMYTNSKKVLELAIPDTPLNAEQIKVINELTTEYLQKGVEIIITVVK